MINKMNPEIKAKWLTALRSGEYTQTTGQLRVSSSFCCLGVLCDLHSKETNNEWGIYNEYLGMMNHLPEEILIWADLINVNGSEVKLPKGNFTTLVILNDNGSTFSEIANIIEAQL